MARTRSRFDDLEAKPKNDAYTGLLTLSLIAMVASCVILYLDYSQYGSTTAPSPNIPAVTRPGGAINQGAPAGGGAAPGILASFAHDAPLLPTLPAPEPIVPVAATEVTATTDGPALTPPE